MITNGLTHYFCEGGLCQIINILFLKNYQTIKVNNEIINSDT